jgi:hypothetical protein
LKCLARRITSGPAAIKQLDDQELDRLLAAEVAAQGRRGRKAAESVQTTETVTFEGTAREQRCSRDWQGSGLPVDIACASASIGRNAPAGHARGCRCDTDRSIDHRIDEQTVVGSRTADMALPAGQEILDPLPLIIAQSIAVHVPASL